MKINEIVGLIILGEHNRVSTIDGLLATAYCPPTANRVSKISKGG